jgi:hypothetical protein
MNATEPSRLGAVIDSLVREAELQELPAGDDAVLRTREGGY